ncbi:MAG: hypothetical protein WBP41_16480 [Saprospiraceae bacterium]
MTFLYNKSSQTNFDPTHPEDGLFQWNDLGTFGFGAFVSKKIGNKNAVQLSFQYQQKGFQEFRQYTTLGGTPSPIYDLTFKNRFDYYSVDLYYKFYILNGDDFGLSLNAGSEYNSLIDYTIESDVDPYNSYYPHNAYQNLWKKNNLSWLISFSFIFDRTTSLEFGFNRSITPVLKTENLIVKDWIWTVRVGISLPNTFNPKKNVREIR